MAINTITYANKSAIYTNSSIPDANKVNDSDMNEIKTVVNDNANLMGDLSTLNTTNKSTIVGSINEINTNLNNSTTYSTSEKTIGTWINGKTIYRKAFYVPSFPNNTTSSFSHGLSNVDFTRIYGIATDGSTVWVDPNAGSASGRMAITTNTSNIFLYANTDRSSLYGYVILEYTKTS